MSYEGEFLTCQIVPPNYPAVAPPSVLRSERWWVDRLLACAVGCERAERMPLAIATLRAGFGDLELKRRELGPKP